MTGHPSRSQSNIANDALRERSGQTGSKHAHQERLPSPSVTSLPRTTPVTSAPCERGWTARISPSRTTPVTSASCERGWTARISPSRTTPGTSVLRGRGWTAHMMEEQMGETDGAAAAWDAEYRAGPRPHPGGPGAGSRRRPVLPAGQRDGDGYLARARGDGASPRWGLTVRYLAGPKRHLLIHFFSAAELGALFGSGSSQSCSSDRNTPGALRPSPAGGPSGKPSGGG
jgi:hypothetical protein